MSLSQQIKAILALSLLAILLLAGVYLFINSSCVETHPFREGRKRNFLAFPGF